MKACGSSLKVSRMRPAFAIMAALYMKIKVQGLVQWLISKILELSASNGIIVPEESSCAPVFCA